MNKLYIARVLNRQLYEPVKPQAMLHNVAHLEGWLTWREWAPGLRQYYDVAGRTGGRRRNP